MRIEEVKKSNNKKLNIKKGNKKDSLPLDNFLEKSILPSLWVCNHCENGIVGFIRLNLEKNLRFREVTDPDRRENERRKERK
jgi:hypothetical protein